MTRSPWWRPPWLRREPSPAPEPAPAPAPPPAVEAPLVEAPRQRRDIAEVVRLPTLLHAHVHMAGTRYHAYDELRDRLAVHTPLRLVREPDNPHDGNAIAVHFADGEGSRRIAYVPRRHAPPLANLLDAGHVLQCRVAEPGRYDDHVYPRGQTFPDDRGRMGAVLIRHLPPDGAEHWLTVPGGLHELEIWLGEGPLDAMPDEDARVRTLAVESRVTGLGLGEWRVWRDTLEEGQGLALRRVRGDRRFPHSVAVHVADVGDDTRAGPEGAGFLGYVQWRHARDVAAHMDTGGLAQAVVASVERTRPFIGLDGARHAAEATDLVVTIQGRGGARTRLHRALAAVEAEIEAEAVLWRRDDRTGRWVRCSAD